MAAFKKWDRVEFKSTKGVVVGTVYKGGSKKVRVVADGMKAEYEVPVQMLKPTTVPPPKDAPSALDKWGLSGYKEAGGEETVCFDCCITLKGKKVLHARNSGTGGCNVYHAVKAGDRDSFNQLEADVKAFIEANGGGVTFEVVDCWLGWKSSFSRMQTFADYLADWRKDMAKYDAPAAAAK